MLDLGLRYDLITGFAFDQDANIIFAELQAAAQAGVFQSRGLPCPCPGFEDFGKSSGRTRTTSPRASDSATTSGATATWSRGGYGRFYDFAYTNANILFAVIGAQSSFGQIYLNNDRDGIKNPDGRCSRSASRCRRTSSSARRRRCQPRRLAPHQAALHRPVQPRLRQGGWARTSRSSSRGLLQGPRPWDPPDHQPAHRRRAAASPGILPRPATRTSASTPRTASPTTRARRSP